MVHVIEPKKLRNWPANKAPPLVFLAFPVSGECPSTSQGCIESKYLPWYTEFTRVRVLVLIFELSGLRALIYLGNYFIVLGVHITLLVRHRDFQALSSC